MEHFILGRARRDVEVLEPNLELSRFTPSRSGECHENVFRCGSFFGSSLSGNAVLLARVRGQCMFTFHLLLFPLPGLSGGGMGWGGGGGRRL